MTGVIRVHLFISGRVQGVFYRLTMRQKAKTFEVKGFCKNLSDGRVEAVIEGEEEKVNKLINWTKRGPLFAKVKNIEIIEEKYKGEFEEFEIRY
ncbi:MAG: acylphosphatase [Candidatus Nealsonbacteria bacterium RBG_13_37_56]|uniref:acylphosphatase n=1 Tax=Candidatus Nealsonbacteria bacterium RBG_13_37_56 TaxID=1801661 RepID=A0A1G2DWY5_9BACT|nr:MAG: acylphosphatase [Candidatus Nealsonbacteria bacterium RBG_13_37_56]